MEAVKHDGEKPRMDLLPPVPLSEAAQVFAFGANKYAANNWVGLDHSRVYGAALRHLMAYWSGEDFDPETGEHHLAHAICNCLMLRGMTILRPDLDDRLIYVKSDTDTTKPPAPVRPMTQPELIWGPHETWRDRLRRTLGR